MVFHMPKFSKSGRKVNDDSEDKTYYSKRGLDSDVPEDKGYYQKSATGTWVRTCKLKNQSIASYVTGFPSH